jgi:hypothetical protein
MRYLLETRRYVNLALLITILLTACASQTASVTPEATRDVEMTPLIAEEPSADQPSATRTPRPTNTPYLTQIPPSTATPTHTPMPTATPTVTRAATATGTPTEVMTEEPGPPVQTVYVHTPTALPVEPVRIPDTDPGPPFTILVDTIRIEEHGKYMVIGTVRNDGSEIYERIGVHASFLDDQGASYGPIDVYCPCSFLEVGAQCPFSLQVISRSTIAAYHLHPLGQPVVYRRPAPVVLSGLVVSLDGIGYVRITGRVTNENAFTVKNPKIAGTLVDASGRIVSVGSTTVLGDVGPGVSVPFDLRIEHEPYAQYQLSAQATRE